MLREAYVQYLQNHVVETEYNDTDLNNLISFFNDTTSTSEQMLDTMIHNYHATNTKIPSIGDAMVRTVLYTYIFTQHYDKSCTLT